MQASVRCLAENGFFLEVGKFDMLMKNKIQLSHFLRGITFKAVLFRVADLLKHEDKARVRHFRNFLLFLMLHTISNKF
jgi:hypothetical protein